MKKTLLSIACIANMLSASSQAITGDYLDINNIKARINSAGDLFSDFTFTTPQFEVPKGSGKGTILIGNLWIGGIDAGGQLKVAGQTYRQTGTDFFPGPVNANGTTDSTTMATYNRVWKINKCDIDNFLINPNPIPQSFIDWPALNSDGSPLAPFVDVNTDGIYDPATGDYPSIKGDQAIFFVYNDIGGAHGETGGVPLGIEIQGMAYAYSCPNDIALYNTVFTNYKIINKSAIRIDSVFIGNWNDLDIGNAYDDFVGCDVTRGAYYAYNGTTIDGSGQSYAYGANPPAQAVVFLSGPFADANGIDDAGTSTPNGTNYGDGIVDNERLGMSKFMYYNNDWSSTGNPGNWDSPVASDYYAYLKGVWKDSTPMTYGGAGYLTGVPCDYMFPGNSDPLGYGTNMIPQAIWDETTTGNTPQDRKGLGATGPFTLQPGITQSVDFAYVWARPSSGGNMASVNLLKNNIDSVRSKFATGIATCGCSSTSGLADITDNTNWSIYPNPANNSITINYKTKSKNYSVNIYDATGKMVKIFSHNNETSNTLSIADFNSGLYLLNIVDGKNSLTKRFVKQ